LPPIPASDHYQNPPAYEKLVGDLDGACSRLANTQNRLDYRVFSNERVARVLRMWTNYGQSIPRR